jgi:hypothetical protein
MGSRKKRVTIYSTGILELIQFLNAFEMLMKLKLYWDNSLVHSNGK